MLSYILCNSCTEFSSCPTHRMKVLPLLHAVHVYCTLFLSLYLLLSLSCSVVPSTSTQFNENLFRPYSETLPNFYQPIPCSSVCSCLNSISSFYFSNSWLTGYCSHSRKKRCLIIWFLLLLSGDVELNPGPSTSFINLACLNVRSASVINHTMDKPALIQEFISDKTLDIFFLTETWFFPDTPPNVLNSLSPDGYTCISIPRSSDASDPPRPHVEAVVLLLFSNLCLLCLKLKLTLSLHLNMDAFDFLQLLNHICS